MTFFTFSLYGLRLPDKTDKTVGRERSAISVFGYYNVAFTLIFQSFLRVMSKKTKGNLSSIDVVEDKQQREINTIIARYAGRGECCLYIEI